MEPLKWWERIIANVAQTFWKRWQCEATLDMGKNGKCFCQKFKHHFGKHITYSGTEF